MTLRTKTLSAVSALLIGTAGFALAQDAQTTEQPEVPVVVPEGTGEADAPAADAAPEADAAEPATDATEAVTAEPAADAVEVEAAEPEAEAAEPAADAAEPEAEAAEPATEEPAAEDAAAEEPAAEPAAEAEEEPAAEDTAADVAPEETVAGEEAAAEVPADESADQTEAEETAQDEAAPAADEAAVETTDAEQDAAAGDEAAADTAEAPEADAAEGETTAEADGADEHAADEEHAEDGDHEAAADHGAGHIEDIAFSFEGPFGTFDQFQLQRGLQVYTEVCAACHGMKQVPIRTLSNEGGPALPEDQVRAYAVDLTQIFDPELGEDRDRLPTDHFPTVTGDGMGPDLSLMAKARAGFHGPYGTGISQLINGIGGPEYIHAVLAGYTGEDMEQAGTVLYENTAFPGGYIGMPPPLSDDLVTYEDGTPATVDQMSRDVSAFLMWTAEPKMMARKQVGLVSVLFLIVLSALLFYTNKRLWAPHKGKH
ncbi:cytochrome C [Paracoccus tegillarcae]|uniref:Cytochrome c1 n=1 Tax=Paracoccus tegillarcae TaxID=1529068 RepID=A0A2K9EJE0_9RHOB|nr:cytochrome c1 [Paracoccus tegillarcae]AUH33487.1 cytochrome C [Paracoccus tegillarcae]